MTRYYLVKFVMDELCVTGITVCDSVRLEHEQLIVKVNAEYIFQEITIGANESFYNLPMHELFESYCFIEISEMCYNELVHQFISTHREGWGKWFRWPSSLIEDSQDDNNV